MTQKKDPTNVRELVNQLVDQEREIKELKHKIQTLQNSQDAARVVVVSMTGKANRQSTFTNYEVKQYANKLTKILTNLPLLKR